VLKPGGKGAFQEPLGHNRVLEFARDYLPYKNKHPVKGTDHPLFMADVERFGRHFTTWSFRGFGLVGMASKILRLRAILRCAVPSTRSTIFCSTRRPMYSGTHAIP